MANQAAINRFKEDSMSIVESNNMLVEQIISKTARKKIPTVTKAIKNR